jgi:hypothetical protein
MKVQAGTPNGDEREMSQMNNRDIHTKSQTNPSNTKGSNQLYTLICTVRTVGGTSKTMKYDSYYPVCLANDQGGFS